MAQNTHIVLLGASPEVNAACVAGDVEHSQALQTGQRHGNAIALQTEEGWERFRMGHNAAASTVFSIVALPSLVCVFASVLHLQLNSLLQVLVGLLHQLFGPQHSVPHHVLGATAAGGDGATKRSNCR